jgi:hypothetical protein
LVVKMKYIKRKEEIFQEQEERVEKIAEAKL